MGLCKGVKRPFWGSNVGGLGAMVELQMGWRTAAGAFQGTKKPPNPRGGSVRPPLIFSDWVRRKGF